jgi:hypothetical protein
MTTLSSYIRARRPDGTECNIDLFDLETALDGIAPGQAYFFPESGRIVFRNEDDDPYDDEEEEDLDDLEEALSIDPIESRVRFRWMEDFVSSVPSVTAKSALIHALRIKRPFRSFKDALVEYPVLREQWFRFEAEKVTKEAIELIESFDWEVLQVVDPRPKKTVTEEVDPAEQIPLTEEEYEWIIRRASEIAAKGGRSQLSLLLKGSKNKTLLKHDLDQSAAYGKLSFLTIEEIENRIDQVIRKGDLVLEYFGGDLPLIVMTDETWNRVRPWATQQEIARAARADDRALSEILIKWRNRPRQEQLHLIDTLSSLPHDIARRILDPWCKFAGKEVRSKIEAVLNSFEISNAAKAKGSSLSSG